MNEFRTLHNPHVFVLGAGAIGDTVSAIPAVKYAAQHIFDLSNLRVMIPHGLRDLFDFLPNENLLFFGVEGQQVPAGSILVQQYDQVPMVLHPSAILSPMRMTLVDYNSTKFLGMILPQEAQNYHKPDLSHIDLRKFELPEKYACIAVTNLNPNRSLPFEVSEKIAKYFLRQNITPVYLGANTKIHDNYNKMDRQGVSPKAGRWMIDLVDKTSYMEATAIMGGAQVVVGADTGLLHLASCTDVKIVCGYTTVAPQLRVPMRHNELGWNFKAITPPGDSCQFCASDLLRYDNNFNECFQAKINPARVMECVKTGLTAENYIKAIENILSW